MKRLSNYNYTEFQNVKLERENLQNFFLLVGGTILTFMFSLFFANTVSIFVKFHVSVYSFIFSVIFTFFLICFGVKKYFPTNKIKMLWIIFLIFIFLVLGSGLIAGSCYDLSYDGQHYHQMAINQLAKGWNPLFKPLPDNFENQKIAIFIDHFPLYTWINAAAIYNLTGNIEYGKLFNLLALVVTFCISFALVLNFKRLSAWQAVLISCLITFNPINIYQVFTYYLDGQIATIICCIIMLFLMLFRRRDSFILLLLLIAMIIAYNIKFTSLVYVILIGGFFSIVYFIVSKKIEAIVIYAASILIGVVILGFHPYVTNTFFHKNPFFPLMGNSNSLTSGDYIERNNSPLNFDGRNTLEKLALSIFSKSENIARPKVTHFKFPFMVYKSEIKVYKDADPRIGGLGPFFGLAIILTTLLLIRRPKNYSIENKIGIGLIFLIIIVTLVNKGCWWARYAPQLWLIPIIAIIINLIESKNTTRKVLSYILVSVLVFNVIIIALVNYFAAYKENYIIKHQLENLSKENKLLYVNFGLYKSVRLKFEEYNIKYIEINKKLDQPWEALCTAKIYRPNYQWGQKLTFGFKGNITQFLGSGWDSGQVGVGWTHGYFSNISIPVEKTKNDIIMKVVLQPFVRPNKIEKTNLNIIVNGQLLEKWLITKPSSVIKSIVIPNKLIKGNMIDIIFALPDAVSPGESEYSKDQRIRGLAFETLQMDELRKYVKGEELNFGSDGNGQKYLINDWCLPDNTFNWTYGNISELYIPIHLSKSDIELRMKAHAFVLPGKVDKQTVYVYVNNEKVSKWIISDQAIHEKIIKIPANMLNDKFLKIKLEMPDAIAPSDLGFIGDNRKQSMAIHSIIISEIN